MKGWALVTLGALAMATLPLCPAARASSVFPVVSAEDAPSLFKPERPHSAVGSSASQFHLSPARTAHAIARTAGRSSISDNSPLFDHLSIAPPVASAAAKGSAFEHSTKPRAQTLGLPSTNPDTRSVALDAAPVVPLPPALWSGLGLMASLGLARRHRKNKSKDHQS